MSIFSKVKVRMPKRNKFDLSHEKKLSFNMGELIPIMLEDVVPGDSFRSRTEIFLRFAPMLAPIMHRVNVFTHFFFVPHRLVWDNWEDFITGGEDGTSTPPFPYIAQAVAARANIEAGSLADYLGVPTIESADTFTNQIEFSSLPFRAYQLIYNEYYRDQNLTAEIAIDTSVNGQESTGDRDIYMTKRTRAWEKDYFTSALPWPQRGDLAEVPITFQPTTNEGSEVWDVTANPPDQAFGAAANISHLSTGLVQSDVAGTPKIALDNTDSLQITVTDLRNAVKLQEWLEKNARGGSRYVEQILSHFGVKSSDARLQRPEYLGGGRNPVSISEVLQTSETSSTAQGNMSGHGISVGQSNGFNKFFEEHGQIIGIMSVLPRTAYQQGLPRKFNKWDKFDYFWPEFAHIGEQSVLQKEINWPWSGTDNSENTFGYAPRYAEYKYACDTVHGDFRTTLDYWHMGRVFGSVPSLNTSFVESDPTHRIFANTDPADHKMWCQLYNKVSAIRPMPYFGNPRFI